MCCFGLIPQSIYFLSCSLPANTNSGSMLQKLFNVTVCLFELQSQFLSLLQITILLSSSGLLSARLITSVGVPRWCRGHHTPSSVPSLRTTDTRPRRRGASSRGLGKSQLPSTVILHSWKYTVMTPHDIFDFVLLICSKLWFCEHYHILLHLLAAYFF